ncbi:MAG TPA: aromatic ring-hydroxylating dioxygenase subunit alpha [Pseudonocardia sp.]|jgi:phenylpropionate dioxygenase-like ring-hydroxylating dioxygenase large terminal subunit|nr:aromatic ring-hydroxylating dioxygenase subunit alpha [Pseudonocardia sp.]
MTIKQDRAVSDRERSTTPTARSKAPDARRPPAPARHIGPERYTSPEFLREEFDHLWSRVWQLACLRSDLPDVGDHLVYEIGTKSILIVRSAPDTVQAFHNVCLHRGRKIKIGCGSAAELRCPYHSFTWALDGTLKEIPERERFSPLDDTALRLLPVRCESFHDWVFINLDPRAAPLSEHLEPVAGILNRYRFDRQYRWSSRSTVNNANWKNGMDAFQESYHARYLHPESVAFANNVDYPIYFYGDHSSYVIPFGVADEVAAAQIAPDWDEALDAMEWSLNAFGEDTSMVAALRGLHPPEGTSIRDVAIPGIRPAMTGAGFDVSALTDDELIDDRHIVLFPNIVLNIFAFGYWLFRVRPHPTDPDYTTWDLWYFHRVPDAMDLPPNAANVHVPEGESVGAVMDQDLRNIPHQQAGMKTGVFPGFVLSDYEARIAHMHDVIDRYLQP